MFQFGSFRTNY